MGAQGKAGHDRETAQRRCPAIDAGGGSGGDGRRGNPARRRRGA